jgi:Reverse transcriptase (RNA-dependent DNA polymerase)
LALENDLHSSIQQNVFSLESVDPTSVPKHLIIPSRVIFDVRMNADGTINKYKARLVAQDNHQDDSTFFDTCADTASAKSINLLLSKAAAQSLDISSENYFFYSPLNEELYLKRPPGVSDSVMPGLVKVNKSIHGLRQGAHEWRMLLHSTLVTIKFTFIQTDNCICKITRKVYGIFNILYLGV